MDDDRQLGGWTKAWRRLLRWPFFRNPKVAHFWEYCRLKASHARCRVTVGYVEVELEPGQFIFGRKVACQETGLSARTLRCALAALIRSKSLKTTIHPTRHFSVITVLNWEAWQGNGPGEGQPNDQPATNRRPTGDQPATTNKNGKKGKKGKKTPQTPRKRGAGLPSLDDYPTLNTPEFQGAWRDWEQHRAEIRHKLTPTSAKRQLKMLSDAGPEAAVKMIEQSIEKGWRGLFPVGSEGGASSREKRQADLKRKLAELDKESEP